MTTEVAAIGRFSSQVLAYFGTQRSVQQVSSGRANTFKYSTGTEYFPQPDANVNQEDLGSVPPTMYYAIRAFFTSRGTSIVYAESLALLVIDIARINKINPLTFLEQSLQTGRVIQFTDQAYSAFNMLRSSSNQVGITVSIDNSRSFIAKEIRA